MRIGRALGAALCGAAVALTLGCGAPPDPDAGLPRGAYLAGDADTLRRALAPLAELRGTPMARTAKEMSDRLAGCLTFEAHDEDGDLAALPAALQCRNAALSPALLALRGEDALVFLMPLAVGAPEPGATPRLRGSIGVAGDGSVSMEGGLHPMPQQGGLAFALPGREPPGPAILNTEDLLLHLRLRPARGLDIAALVPEGGQGDDLFKLKSELFAGAVLDGSVEVAVYMPRAGQVIPPMALALGVSMRSAAVAAMDAFLRELEATWPLHARSVSFGQGDRRDDVAVPGVGPGNDGRETIPGRCIFDLQILPEFAPCYAATPTSLVVGWNPPSVAQALAPRSGEGVDADGGLFVALSRLPEADRLLHQAIAPDLPGFELDYGWETLRIEGRRGEDEEVRLRIELVSGEAS